MNTVIRIGKDTLAFTTEAAEKDYVPYHLNNGMSMAANLRSAFDEMSELSADGDNRRLLVLIDTPVMLVPVDEFNEQQVVGLYQHAFTDYEGKTVLTSVVPELNAVAVFAVTKDLLTVLNDRFNHIRIIPVVQPVWKHLQQHSFSGPREKLYAYFHDYCVDVFCFNKNRFRFHNTFPANYAADALYFILNVWKQVGYNAESDELHLVGNIPQKDWMTEQLRRYVERTHLIGTSSRVPYDLTIPLI